MNKANWALGGWQKEQLTVEHHAGDSLSETQFTEQ